MALFLMIKKRKNFSNALVNERRSHSLLRKALKGMVNMLPEVKKKNTLYKVLRSDFNTKVISKVFKSLKFYFEYRQNKKATDFLMTKAINLIS